MGGKTLRSNPTTLQSEDVLLCWLPLLFTYLFLNSLIMLSGLLHFMIEKLDFAGTIQQSAAYVTGAASRLTHHTVSVVSPFAVQVGQMTVFVPPGTTVGEGTVTQSDVIVIVNRCPGSALVVGHGIAWGSSITFSNIN